MNDNYFELIKKYGKDILNNKTYQSQDKYIQHGNTSIKEHEINVTIYCLKIAEKYKIKVDTRSLIRGTLLHDYFLYDWHIKDKNNKLHGFRHAKKALDNACRDFELNDIEKNMIYCHMFPLHLRIPKTKEGLILCLADKIVATKETLRINNNWFNP